MMSQTGLMEPVIHGIPPRIPNTPQRAELERRRGIRELVFGAQDGILTTMGLVTGLDAAAGSHATVLIAGFLALGVGALSMGAGEYLGGKSEREVVKNTIAMERRELIEQPEEEVREQVGYYRLKGFSQEEAELIVRRLATNHEMWLYEMVRDEFGIDPRIVDETSIGPALKLALSFILGGLIPIIPHMFALPGASATILSFACAAILLFAIGCISGSLSGRNPLVKGLEIAAFGTGIFAVSYAAGRCIPPLFGQAPVAAGG